MSALDTRLQELARNVEFPAKFQCLFQPKRYKVLYGGRGGAKSWGIGRALLLLGCQKTLRILCTRELQASIEDSVHQLLSDQIRLLGLDFFYRIEKQGIYGINGTTFSFDGIRHNINKIRSYEGVDICWVEEAHKVTKASWRVLIPTIRKPDSEIWVSFNPELESDETYTRFVKNPPNSCFSVEVNWRDNPWFPDVLKEELEELKSRDPDEYLHVWEGHCLQVMAGAVYANEIRAARMSEPPRIGRVPYDPAVPVETFWDLGWNDTTAIWFRQKCGFEYHYIDYYEDRKRPLAFYSKVLQDRGYVYSCHWLPHDSKAKELGSGMSIYERLKGGSVPVRVVKRLEIEDGIDAARTIFPLCWFDAENCSTGIVSLSKYRFEVDEKTGSFGRTPVHDMYSHGADAFRYSGVAAKAPDVGEKGRRAERLSSKLSSGLRTMAGYMTSGDSGTAWME